jgi:DNA-binding MarR family transcriptional regulator
MMNQAEELRYLVLALQREGNRQLTEALRPIGLSPAQAEVMQVLDQFGELSLVELGERLVCETGSPSRLVKDMVKEGMIDRKPDPKDGRALRLSLTEQGKTLIQKVNQVEDTYNQSVAELAKDLPIPLDTALDVLHKLVAGTPTGHAVILRKHGP